MPPRPTSDEKRVSVVKVSDRRGTFNCGVRDLLCWRKVASPAEVGVSHSLSAWFSRYGRQSSWLHSGRSEM
eukprot:9555636-Ditylum_brightwellii.AAC.1